MFSIIKHWHNFTLEKKEDNSISSARKGLAGLLPTCSLMPAHSEALNQDSLLTEVLLLTTGILDEIAGLPVTARSPGAPAIGSLNTVPHKHKADTHTLDATVALPGE